MNSKSLLGFAETCIEAAQLTKVKTLTLNTQDGGGGGRYNSKHSIPKKHTFRFDKFHFCKVYRFFYNNTF